MIKKRTNTTQQRLNAGLTPAGPLYSTISLHRVAYVARYQRNPPAGMQVSHLCDVPACFQADHLTAETGVDNKDRRFCKGEIRCPHHNYEVVVSLCQHAPRCIKKPFLKEEFNCCAAHDGEDSQNASPMALASQTQLEEIRGQDFSDLPASSLDEPVDDEDEQPSDGQHYASTIPDSYESHATPLIPPSSPPVITAPVSATDSSEPIRPPSKRARLQSPQRGSEAAPEIEEYQSASEYQPSTSET